jgi:hypothetical protein
VNSQWGPELIEPFVGKSVLVSIQGEDGEPVGKPVPKRVARVAAEGDFVKVYFDKTTFVAVPRTGAAAASEGSFTAVDEAQALKYTFTLCKSWLV